MRYSLRYDTLRCVMSSWKCDDENGSSTKVPLKGKIESVKVKRIDVETANYQ